MDGNDGDKRRKIWGIPPSKVKKQALASCGKSLGLEEETAGTMLG